MADDRKANDKPEQPTPAGSTMETARPRVTLRRANEARLRELGLWDSDELVISMRPSLQRNKRTVRY